MKRIFHKAKNKKEADDWDIYQQISMTPDERFAIVNEMKKRVFGKKVSDVKEVHRKK
mgnify:CR=1 FL=1